MERRTFLKLVPAFLFIRYAESAIPALASTPDDSLDQEPTLDDETTTTDPVEEIAGEDLVSDLEEGEERTIFEPTNRGGDRPERTFNPDLEVYLDRISEAKATYKNILGNVFNEGRDIFAGFKNFSQEQVLQDFELYFPMYWACQEEYSIPWFLTWIVHVHESTVSRDPRNPAAEKNSQHKGCMQRDPRFYDEAVVEKAVGEWGFLKDLPQRQTKKAGFSTDDFAEILFFGDKLRRDANQTVQPKHADWSDEQCFLQALYSYSADWPARARIYQYQKLKSVFNQ